MGPCRYGRATRAARVGVVVGVCTLAAAFSAGTQPGQPAVGAIAGRLVDASTGGPIVDGVLVLRELISREQRMVSTGAMGEFRLVDLPAATYSLHATALGYVGRQYGQRHPMETGVPIDLAAGETRANIDVALQRSGAITGRVTTQNGEPLAFAAVEALRPEIDNSLRVLLPVGRAESDRRGEFRLEGLPPGHYYVAAIGPADAGAGDPAGRMPWAQTFFPGVSSPATAGRIRLSPGDVRTDVDFPLLAGSRFAIRGQLVNPDGLELATGSVIMSSESDDGLGLSVAHAGVVRPDGTFAFENVPQGSYRLRARARTTQPGPALFSSFQLAIRNADVGNAVLFLHPGASLVGQVDIADGATAPVPALDDLSISAPMADGARGSGLARSQVAEDGRFRLVTPEGNRVIRLDGLPDPWSLESVLYRGRNVIDIPFELRSGEERERIRLVLTDRTSRLTGLVKDENGHPITDRAIVAVPVNPTFWHAGSRHVRLTYAELSGRYELIGLPAGVYLIAAMSGIHEGDLYDISVFREIAAAGAEVVIEAGETTTFDVVLTRQGDQPAGQSG